MPETEQLLMFNDKADYYQLWKEKIHENTFLSKKLINSKEKVIGLQMKLIDFICSVKSLEAELDIDPSEEVKKLLQSQTCQSPEKDVSAEAGKRDQRTLLLQHKPAAKEVERTQTMNQDSLIETITSIQEGDKTMFKCRVCNKVFALSSNLREHLRTHHGMESGVSCEKGVPTSSEPRTFQCRVCDKKFKLSIQLVRHQQMHKYDKSHKAPHIQHLVPKRMLNSDTRVRRTSQNDDAEPTSSAAEPEIIIPGSISIQMTNSGKATTTSTPFEYNLNPNDGISTSSESNSQSGTSEDIMITSNIPEPEMNARVKTEALDATRGNTDKPSSEKSKQRLYAVVEFEEKQVGVVCTSWLFDNNTRCYWPPENPSKMTMEGVTPTESWVPCHIVHVLSFAESYNEAQYKLRKSEYTSELSSDNSDVEKKKRKVRRKKKLSNSFVDDVEEEREKESDQDQVMVPCTVNLEQLNIPSDSRDQRGDEQALILPTSLSLSDESRYAVNLVGDSQPSYPSEVQEYEAGADSSGDVSYYVEEVKEQLYHHEILLTQILKCLQPLPALPEVHGIPTLPMNDMMELNHLENAILQDDVKSYMVSKLGSIGGNNVPDITRRIMKFLMKPSLSLLLNWCGQRGKFAFKNLKLKDIILDAVRENSNFKQSKDKDIEDAIKMFLKHSKDREGGRFMRSVQNFESGNLFPQSLAQVHYSNNGQ